MVLFPVKTSARLTHLTSELQKLTAFSAYRLWKSEENKNTDDVFLERIANKHNNN